MPQLNMLKPDDDLIGLRVELDFDEYVPNGPCYSTIYIRRRAGEWTMYLRQRWIGLEVDFLTTYLTDVYTAWAFGTAEAVLAAHLTTVRAAKRHRKDHEFS